MIQHRPSENLGSTPLCSATDLRLGAKANHLSWLIEAGCSVPDGLVLNDSQIQHFLDSFAKKEECRTPEPGRIGATCIDTEVRCFQNLGDELIIRSSAVGEDSASASYAGQLLSLRCENRPASLHSAIMRCREAFHKRNVLDYGCRMHSRLEGLSVIVQNFVTADFAGVLFTQSPLSDAHMRIEWVAGGCAQLVDGQVNPFSVELPRDDIMVCAQFQEADFDRAEQSIIANTFIELKTNGADAQILARLANAALKLEQRYGRSLDLEWAVSREEGHDVIWLLQARPVTTAPARQQAMGADKALSTISAESDFVLKLSRSNIGENYPVAVCPLLYSVAKDAYTHYFRNLGRAFGLSPANLDGAEPFLRHLVGSRSGCISYNLSNIYACFDFAPAAASLKHYWNVFLSVPEDSKSVRGQRNKWNEWASLFRMGFCGLLSFLTLPRGIAKFERAVSAFHLEARAVRGPQNWRKSLSTFRLIREKQWLPASLADAAAMFGIGFMTTLLKRSKGHLRGANVGMLLETDEGLESRKPLNALKVIEGKIRASQFATDMFHQYDASEIWKQLKVDNAVPEVMTEIDHYLERWGFRSSGELMLDRETWFDRPQGLIALLKGRLEYSETCKGVRVDLQTTPAKLDIGRFSLLWSARRLTRWGINLRERARLKQAQLYHGLRLICLNMAKELTFQKIISSENDIFFLTFDELEGLAGGSLQMPSSLKTIIQARRAEFDALRATQPKQQDVLSWSTWIQKEASDQPKSTKGNIRGKIKNAFHETTSRRFHGLGASPGLSSAPVCVIPSLDDIQNFKPGCILVARHTDPGWTPYFAQASGLILEYGGVLCHGAIVAREFGIPMVTEATGVLDELLTGQQVTLNGSEGWFEVNSVEHF